MDTHSNPKKAKSMQSKLTDVQIIQRNNDLALVQWTNHHNILQRSWVAERLLVDVAGHSARVANPEQGLPYGVEFWRMIGEIKISSKDVDRELKQRGIWTLADLRARPNEVVGALVAAHGVDLATIFQAAIRYEKELKKED